MELLAEYFALALTALAAWHDTRTGLIPNRLTLPPLIVAPVLFGIVYGWQAWVASATGLLLCGAVPYVLFRLGAGGGGDVKLFAGLGALLGVTAGLEVEIVAFAIASCGAVAVLAWRGQLLQTLGNTLWLALGWALPKRWRRMRRRSPMTSIRFARVTRKKR